MVLHLGLNLLYNFISINYYTIEIKLCAISV